VIVIITFEELCRFAIQTSISTKTTLTSSQTAGIPASAQPTLTGSQTAQSGSRR
jgi:hypothetical protein